MCRSEAPSGEGPAADSSRRHPAEWSRGVHHPEETQSPRAQAGVPLLTVQQGLPEQQQPEPAHPLSRSLEISLFTGSFQHLEAQRIIEIGVLFKRNVSFHCR